MNRERLGGVVKRLLPLAYEAGNAREIMERLGQQAPVARISGKRKRLVVKLRCFAVLTGVKVNTPDIVERQCFLLAIAQLAIQPERLAVEPERLLSFVQHAVDHADA